MGISRKALTFVLCGLLSVALAPVSPLKASAETITFDDIPTNSLTSVPSTYAGLSWQGFFVFNVEDASGPGEAYNSGVASPPNVAFNAACDAATQAVADTCNIAEFSSSSPFTFGSTYLTGAYNNGLQVLVTGYLAGNVEDTELLTVYYSFGATLFNFDWEDLDQVSFESWGGTQIASGSGSGSNFTMDNLTVDLSTSQPTGSVPEPSTFVSLAAALAAGLVWRSSRQLSNAKN
jgi:PEP-CTERM motif